jgi:hypothetical protein
MSNAFDLDQGASEPDGNIFQIDRRLVVGAHHGRLRRTRRRSDLELRSITVSGFMAVGAPKRRK